MRIPKWRRVGGLRLFELHQEMGRRRMKAMPVWMERMHTEELGFEREEGWREVQGNEFARISNM